MQDSELKVLPGDTVPYHLFDQVESIDEKAEGSKVIDRPIKLGEGVIQSGDNLVVTLAGTLHYQNKDNKFSVKCKNRKRYIPKLNDGVIGFVMKKQAESFMVDIGTYSLARLDVLDFEGATRKNRPNLNVGDTIYVKVSSSVKDLETQVVAFNVNSGKSEGYGHLVDGYTFKADAKLTRRLLETKVLKGIGNLLSFEIVVGSNFRIWIKGEDEHKTLVLKKMLLSAEDLSDSQFLDLSRKLLEEI